ncbi:hypothetical protein CALCODRAFT_279662 [Calocera cornea HHB12733]|uniref:Uncharacterized protein n=1 Tax=Calocera cornea HHB12733 TaxID=1353952 RepID=A0A165JS15_9BASI|nr:hypothetical protein CALCODRAFT_279662 [Calocera cornea HHB12733]
MVDSADPSSTLPSLDRAGERRACRLPDVALPGGTPAGPATQTGKGRWWIVAVATHEPACPPTPPPAQPASSSLPGLPREGRGRDSGVTRTLLAVPCARGRPKPLRCGVSFPPVPPFTARLSCAVGALPPLPSRLPPPAVIRGRIVYIIASLRHMPPHTR